MTFKRLLAGLFVISTIIGCGVGHQDLATQDIQKATDNAKVVRSIYDAAGGDYDKVPESDKKRLFEIYKDDAGARRAFDKIKNPPGGLPVTPPNP